MSAIKSHYDVVIIGSGAGGATLAQKLAETGKSILILERGPFLPVEPRNWDPKQVFIDHCYKADEHWINRKGKEFRPNIHYYVGGNTIFYGAALYRFRRSDFDETVHHGGAISPAWPISYQDLAPYYTEAEKLWQVHGERGADPTDDATAPPYAFEALEHDPEIAKLKTRLTSLGLHPFKMPMALERDVANPQQSPCIRCRTCGGFPCLREAKCDGRKMVERALNFSDVKLICEAKVERLKLAPNGREIKTVQFEKDGERHKVSGGIVVLAAGAINSAALLLASDDAEGEKGLANSSDQVGRNYMFHTASATLSLSWPKVETNFPKTMAINDFYHGDPDGGFDHPMGHIQMLEYMDADVIRGELASFIPWWIVPKWVARGIGDRLIPFLVMTEDLPESRNRVRLHKNGQIGLDYWHNNMVAHKRLLKRFHHYMNQADRFCHCRMGHRAEMDGIIPLYGTAHQCGTLRMGDDPKSAVVGADCKAHDVENLYVVDTSVFVSSAAVNPALTCIANSLRVADIIADLI